MGLLRNLFNYEKTDALLTKQELIEINVCPNCWGRQEYQDEFYDEYHKKKATINHDISHKKAFIQEFVETNITGIRLKSHKGDIKCYSCKSVF